LFESALAGTCQILQREDYLGVLEPWRDYIPLESEYSNMDEVIRVMNDLDKCQEIVSNAKRSLIESKMFDYSQLVETACNGLLAAEGVNSAEWNQFSEFLHFSQKAQELSPELHDATLHLISEVMISNAPLSVFALQIMQDTEKFELMDWLQIMTQLTKDDSMSTRSPWIWRSVPTGRGRYRT
jgi:hypothetical protein